MNTDFIFDHIIKKLFSVYQNNLRRSCNFCFTFSSSRKLGTSYKHSVFTVKCSNKLLDFLSLNISGSIVFCLNPHNIQSQWIRGNLY